jgi:hypothetical protein
MKVRIPGISKENSKPEFEAMLTGLGFPPLDDLDEESAEIAEHYAGLLDERAAFARRGWIVVAETKLGYPEPDYTGDLMVALVGCADVALDEVAEHGDGSFSIKQGSETRRYRPAYPDDDITDGRWADPRPAVSLAEQILADHGYAVVELDWDGTSVIYAVIPGEVIAAVDARGGDVSSF